MIKTTGNIAASANIEKESVVMGDVSIGADSTILFYAVLRGDAAIFPVVFIMTDFLISSFHTVFSITSPFFLLNMLLEKKKRGHQQMLSLDSTLRFIRKCVSFYLLLSPVFSLTGVLDSYLT